MNVIRLALLAAAIAAGLSATGCSTVQKAAEGGWKGAQEGFHEDKEKAEKAAFLAKCRVNYGPNLNEDKCSEIAGYDGLVTAGSPHPWTCVKQHAEYVECSRKSSVVAKPAPQKGKGKVQPPQELMDVRYIYRLPEVK
jgi:hypothetical protein